MNVDWASLMARIAGGDEPAFAELYDELAPTLYGVALRVVRDPAQSEEVTQEVLVELWRQAARFDPSRGGVHAWAVTIARRRAVDRVRSEQSPATVSAVTRWLPPANRRTPLMRCSTHSTALERAGR